MGYDGFLDYGEGELVNISRTAQLAESMGIDTVWITPSSVQWIQDALGGVDYDDITAAPWYDAGYPASTEFAGIIPLSFLGLDDSTRESSVTEYVTDGGNTGKARNATLPLVANAVIIASTDRGAEYGKRWLDRRLRGSSDGRSSGFCSGVDLTYFRNVPAEDDDTAPLVAHRRNVAVTRAASVTRKRRASCSTGWWVTFTLTAGDPYEYGETEEWFTGLGDPDGVPVSSTVVASGSIVLTQQGCLAYDYSPIYDPLYPALVPPPSVPNFYPTGWNIVDGMTFDRSWVEVKAPEPTTTNVVPVITLTSDVDARMVRVSIWSSTTDIDAQCEPLFSVVATYMPALLDFVIDGEQKASYVWDGFSPVVRRADSLVYSPEANPVQWTAFNDLGGTLLVTLDIFTDSGEYEGDGTVRASLAFVSKSD